MPTSSATTVRVKDGETVTTDGPFAETKEALGGFYLVNAKDLDEAIELAARIPAAKHGSIEVRPIWEFDAADGRARRPRPSAPPAEPQDRVRVLVRDPGHRRARA